MRKQSTYTMNVEQQNLMMNIGLKPNEQLRMDFYFDMSFHNVCRICLEKNQGSRKMSSLFENSKPGHFSIMIMAFASVEILEGDGLPSMICNRCISVLNIAWQFKQQCENSDAKLRQYFENAQHLQVTPDLESFNIGVKNEQNMFPLQQQHQQQQQQHDAQILPHLPTQHTQNPVIPTPTIPDQNIQQILIQEQQQQTNSECQKKSQKCKSPTRLKECNDKKEPKQHQCDTCGKTFTRREYLTQHIRIHTGEKPYRCHLCEKRFINSGHLTTHMRTHTGEKPHGCTLCPKAFSTRQELNKHNMVHSGERPFVCKLCGKRFGSSSNLYSHLKHHTGEKNFTCEHCGKAFYTKQELKQHFVVHTGEKAYLCEQCNKRFSQIAHLRRHSKLHK